jgi:hypothetical protein
MTWLVDNPHMYAKVPTDARSKLNHKIKILSPGLKNTDEHNYYTNIKLFYVDGRTGEKFDKTLKWNHDDSYPLTIPNFRMYAFKLGHNTVVENLVGYKVVVCCKLCESATVFAIGSDSIRTLPNGLPKCIRCRFGYPLLFKWVQLSSGGNAKIVEDFDTFKLMNYGKDNEDTKFSIIHNDCRHTQKISRMGSLLRGLCVSQGDKTPEQYLGECVFCSNETDNIKDLMIKVGRKGMKQSKRFGQFGEDQLEEAIVKFNKNNIDTGIHFHLLKGFEGSVADFVLSMNILDDNNCNNNTKYDLPQMGIQCKAKSVGNPVTFKHKYNDNTIMYIISHPANEETISRLYLARFKDFEVTPIPKTGGYKILLSSKSKNQLLRIDPNQVGVYLLKYYLELAQEKKLMSYWSSIRPWKHADGYAEFKVYKIIQLVGLSSKNYDYRYNPNYGKIDNYLVVHIQKAAIKLIDPIFLRWTCNVCNGLNCIEESKCTCCDSAQDSSCNPKNMDEYVSDFVVACFNDQAKTRAKHTDGKSHGFKVSYTIRTENKPKRKIKQMPYLIEHGIDGFNLCNSYDGYSFMVPSKLLIDEDNPLEYRMNVPLLELNKDYSIYKYETKEGLNPELLCCLFGIKSDSAEKLSPKHIIPYGEPFITSTKLVDLDNYIS